MSRLSQALQWQDTRERLAFLEPLRHVRITEQFDTTAPFMPDEARRYKLTATFEAKAVIRDSMRHQPSAHEVQHIARRQVIHEVFGEYVPPLHEAIYALHNYETDRAIRLLKAILANFEAPEPFKEPKL